MSVGDRIKRARNFRGMTQKELGIAVGFDEKSVQKSDAERHVHGVLAAPCRRTSDTSPPQSDTP